MTAIDTRDAHNMASDAARDVEPPPHRCEEPPSSDRSVETGSPQYASGLANPEQPTAVTLAKARERDEGLGGRVPLDDGVASDPRAGSDRAGNVAVLGATADGVAKPLPLGEGSADPQYLLRPCDVVRLLNSTPRGAVINERQLFRHRNRAGDRIGGKRRIDFLRYIVWLVEQRDARVRRREAKAQRRRQERLTLNGIVTLIESQQYRCALSGRLLTPEDAALDHILALSRGGRHEIANAQVLHKDINRAKGTLTNEEFITLCREVVIHALRRGLCPALDEEPMVTSSGR